MCNKTKIVIIIVGVVGRVVYTFVAVFPRFFLFLFCSLSSQLVIITVIFMHFHLHSDHYDRTKVIVVTHVYHAAHWKPTADGNNDGGDSTVALPFNRQASICARARNIQFQNNNDKPIIYSNGISIAPKCISNSLT